MVMVVDEPVKHQYQLAMRSVAAARVPYVIGGAWAVEHYTPLGRATLDLDLMVEPSKVEVAVQALTQHGARLLGRDLMEVRMALGGVEIDLVHHFAQGEHAVDRTWHQHALPGYAFDLATLFAAPSELIWTKVFIASRHRFDGADVVHLIRATHRTLDWKRLHAHLRAYPELLMAYLNLFEFCYPGERDTVPAWIWKRLIADVQTVREPIGPKICRGPLLDSTSFIFDGIAKGYQDVRQS